MGYPAQEPAASSLSSQGKVNIPPSPFPDGNSEAKWGEMTCLLLSNCPALVPCVLGRAEDKWPEKQRKRRLKTFSFTLFFAHKSSRDNQSSYLIPVFPHIWYLYFLIFDICISTGNCWHGKSWARLHKLCRKKIYINSIAPTQVLQSLRGQSSFSQCPASCCTQQRDDGGDVKSGKSVTFFTIKAVFLEEGLTTMSKSEEKHWVSEF